ncbi:MAG: Carnitine operon protein CaiE [Phycisphaerae bacterium]|nr:Carnitine operon protein CaiE [Phycisphaerae bacterium]
MGRLEIYQHVLDAAVARAWLAAPGECCGALLARGEAVVNAIAVSNRAGEAARFDADALDLMWVEQEARQRGLRLAGYYHSHPDGALEPSAADRSGSVWADAGPALHLIISPGGAWAVFDASAGWRRCDARLLEPPFDVAAAGPHAIRGCAGRRVWIASDAVVSGDVAFGPHCSIWHHTTIRGDVAPIRLGARVNVQDLCMLHCHGGVPLDIGDDVTIGHHAVVHCRRIGARCLIGIRSVILDEAEIGEECVIAAGAVVVPGTVVPPGSVVMGVPGRVVRATSARERQYVSLTTQAYIDLAMRHAAGEFVAP